LFRFVTGSGNGQSMVVLARLFDGGAGFVVRCAGIWAFSGEAQSGTEK
jgi:hypothetical protein